MLQAYSLSILIFLPLLAAFLLVFMPKPLKGYYKFIALGVSIIQLIIGVNLYLDYESLNAPYSIDAFQFVERVPWINLDLQSLGKLSAEYFLGIDGLSVGLVLLSIVVLLIGVLASWNIQEKVKAYFSLYLVLNASIIGCFVALDFLLFYLFFEFMLLPMYFLIGLWGGPRREYASIKFFLYTLLGSIFILIVMIGLYTSVIDPGATATELGLIADGQPLTPFIIDQVQERLQNGEIMPNQLVRTFNMVFMTDAGNVIPDSFLSTLNPQLVLGHSARFIGFLLLFVGFAIKVPVVPFHTWLPDAHVEAPTPISVVLAGILLKIGGYGLFRTAYLMFPDGAVHYAWWVGLLGVISIIYGAFNALASEDLKRLIAFSSVSHMGFVLLGLAALSVEGVSGAIYQMVSHGFISAALFLIAGVIYDRTHDRLIENYSGLASQMPKYTVIVVIFFFASLGLPGFSGFIAEILVLLGSFGSATVEGIPLLPRGMAVTAVFGLVLSAAYYLWTIQRMFFGKYHVKRVSSDSIIDINKREFALFLPLIVFALMLGIFPSVLLDLINDSVVSFVNTILKF
ncbi:MAG: NADH-quinone oxidoreductase subunit M [Bacteroidota bacterium]